MDAAIFIFSYKDGTQGCIVLNDGDKALSRKLFRPGFISFLPFFPIPFPFSFPLPSTPLPFARSVPSLKILHE